MVPGMAAGDVDGNGGACRSPYDDLEDVVSLLGREASPAGGTGDTVGAGAVVRVVVRITYSARTDWPVATPCSPPNRSGVSVVVTPDAGGSGVVVDPSYVGEFLARHPAAPGPNPCGSVVLVSAGGSETPAGATPRPGCVSTTVFKLLAGAAGALGVRRHSDGSGVADVGVVIGRDSDERPAIKAHLQALAVV